MIIYSDNSNVQTIDLGDGSYYIGEVADGFRDGYGFTYNNIGMWTEFGLYKRGVLNGSGMRTNYKDGSKYLGEFVAGVPNGEGQYYPDANKNGYIAGDFVNGIIDGTGWEKNEYGIVICRGSYHNGEREYGLEYDEDGNLIAKYVNGVRTPGDDTSSVKPTVVPSNSSSKSSEYARRKAELDKEYADLDKEYQELFDWYEAESDKIIEYSFLPPLETEEGKAILDEFVGQSIYADILESDGNIDSNARADAERQLAALKSQAIPLAVEAQQTRIKSWQKSLEDTYNGKKEILDIKRQSLDQEKEELEKLLQ